MFNLETSHAKLRTASAQLCNRLNFVIGVSSSILMNSIDLALPN